MQEGCSSWASGQTEESRFGEVVEAASMARVLWHLEKGTDVLLVKLAAKLSAIVLQLIAVNLL